jgi:DNA-binding winged helix-turn-helix (wHTH) protein
MQMLRQVECTVARCRPAHEVLVEVRGGRAWVNGRPVTLSRQEGTILATVAAKAGQIVTPMMLLSALYPNTKRAQQKIVDVLVCKVRTKLRAVHPSAGDAIRTVRGRGIAFGKPTYRSIPFQGIYLPPADGIWVPKQKVMVLHAVQSGKITERQLLHHYPDISPGELSEWRNAFVLGGLTMMRNKQLGERLPLAA